jgi:threonine dehydratase
MTGSGPISTARPVLTSSYLNGLTGAELFFKCENFQKAAAFKARGASNAVFGLTDANRRAGCGDPFQRATTDCPAYAAGRRGIPCTVVMPRTAPQAKKDAVKGYGGRVVECEPSTSQPRGGLCRGVAETGPSSCTPTTTRA